MTEKQPRSNRRSFARGVLTVAGVGTIAGCTGDNDSSEGGSTGSNPVDEAPANDTVNPNNSGYDNSKPGNTSNGTENGTIGNGTVENGTVETPKELTGRQIYFDWIHGENEQILEDNKGYELISFQAVDDALENGFQNGGRNQAIAEALETASQEYHVGNNDYEDRHRHILSALHTTLEQKEGDQWNFDIFGMKDSGQSPALPDGVDYSKIWVENEDGEYTDINAGLSERYRHTTHIQGEEIGNTAKNITSRIKQQLQFMRNPEKNATHPGHDYEALQNAVEYYREVREREYSDEDIEEINGFWIKKLGSQIMGDGIPVPSSIEDWKEYDEGLEAGPEVFLGLNETHHNEGYDGEPAQFTVKDEVDGSVTVGDLPDDYTIAEDGVPGNPAA
ncbi:hypothetical protein [Halorubrum ezzemoulense]|uniref:hypothetical protein n=1 Tax=Halorubrum ezzemoulense TaxID=337243 RepID=UPI00232D818F|nr:hypothetical protein [Halorubrum ezzemoulense]MDB2240694.1 hypothetical protein [Halorubrum ezzemoulense]